MEFYLQLKYPSALELCEALAPHRIDEIREELDLKTLSACMWSTSPLLVEISNVYSRKVAIAYLQIFILDLCKSINTKDTMDSGQIMQLAKLLYNESFHKSVYVIHEFFRRCLCGYYGEYYGSVDCVKVMYDYRLFINDFKAIYQYSYIDKQFEIKKQEILLIEKTKQLTKEAKQLK